jgi:DegV family protein with EDD domain
MAPVAVVTDSTHYLSPAMLAGREIHEVSLYVSSDGYQTRECEITDYDSFYAALRDGRELPTTSQPSIGDFTAVYEPLLDAGRDIVSIHLAGGMSGTVSSARQAASAVLEHRADRRIEVIDSRAACGGLGCVVLAAADLAAGGADLDSVVARASETRAALRMWFCIDTLEHLHRGGRIATAQKWLGGALKIKPILTIEDEITPLERVRTSARAFERMVAFLSAQASEGADGWVIQHIQEPETLERLRERGRELFGCEPLFSSEIGPVIGSHIGPGLIGVGGIPRALLAPGS